MASARKEHPIYGVPYLRVLDIPGLGHVMQWLEQRPDGSLVGWEVYEDGAVSEAVAVSGTIIPRGYVHADEAMRESGPS